MNNERMYQIIRYPHVSEKTARLQAESNQYVFEVSMDATKGQIKQAVEGLFEVNVENVQVVKLKGKSKSFRFRPGRQKDWKKAYVRIKAGQTIEDLNAE
jgi:large subunit ribosomal protein L23